MVSRPIRALAPKSITLSVFSIIFSILGLIGSSFYVKKFFDLLLTDISSTESISSFFGILLIMFILLRSIFSDVYILLDDEEKIPVGTGVEANSRYGFRKFLNDTSNEIVIIGQNLRSLLSDHENLDLVARSLKTNPKFSVTFILTTDEAIKAISPYSPEKMLIEFKQTVRELKDFITNKLSNSEKHRVNIFFHRGASSLSAIIRDPKILKKSELVFTAKWSTETEPMNRVYCIVRRWENPDVFKKLYGYINILTGVESISLDEMCLRLGV